MIIFLKLTIAGSNTGPFDILTDSDDFKTPIQVGVTWQTLHNGFNCTVVPDDATIIRAKSTGLCTNYADAYIDHIPTPTPTPTSTSSPIPTQTPTPTPTSSPIPIVSYMHLGTSDDYATVIETCIQEPNRSYYTNTGAIIINTRIYEDVELSIPHIGDPTRYKLIAKISPDSLYIAYLINASGYVIDAETCEP